MRPKPSSPPTQCDKFYATKDYSYRATRCSGDGWVLIGDAHGFLDPLYSSGVLLALKSGQMAADAIVEGLRKDDLSARHPEFSVVFHHNAEFAVALMSSGSGPARHRDSLQGRYARRTLRGGPPGGGRRDRQNPHHGVDPAVAL